MALEKLPKEQWKEFFDNFSKKFCKDKIPEFAQIEVLSPELGDQEETLWVKLMGITYDPKDDVLDIALGELDLDHMIYHPTEIWVDVDEDGFINEMEVIHDNGELSEVINLRRYKPAPDYETKELIPPQED